MSTKRTIIAIAVAAIVGGALFIAGERAEANTIMGVEGSCQGLAQQAGLGAELRDLGATYKDVEEEITLALQDAYKTEGSYIKDEEDVEFVIAAMKFAFSTHLAPDRVREQVWKVCMYKGNGVHI